MKGLLSTLWLLLTAPLVVTKGMLIDTPEQYFGGDCASIDTYVEWAATVSSKYTTSSFFANGADGAAVHWRVDTDTQLLHLAVAARAQDGWVGFGLSEIGGMKGADFAIFETANPDTVRDAHALEVNFPTDDDCQDWTYVSHINEGGFLIFEAIRKLDTGDQQDFAIADDSDLLTGSSRIIAAWSADQPTAVYHKNNFAKGIVRWYVDGDELGRFQQQMQEQADGFFEIRIPDFHVPMEDDHYVYFCVPWAEFVKQGAKPDETFTVIGVEPIVAHPKHVHHVSLLGDPKDIVEMADADGIAKCPGDEEDSLSMNSWYEIVSGFDQATIGNAYPENVGQIFGPGGAVQSMRFQMHYKNVQRDPNVMDNSGVRLYYSHTPRPDELGTLVLADALVQMEGTPLGQGLSRHKFTCDPGCSEIFLGEETVNVFQEIFHMHNKGVAIYLDVLREGKLLKRTGINTFDDSTQGFPYFRQYPYQLQKGDSFEVSCFFRTNVNASYGYGLNDEMCQAYISYWPKKTALGGLAVWNCFFDSPFPGCGNEVAMEVFPISADVPERTFGVAPDQCASTPDSGSSLSRMSTSTMVIMMMITMIMLR